jgi:hypothetical protein
MNNVIANRPLTSAEYELAYFMLTIGGPEGHQFLTQLEQAEITPWRCECGCASIIFQIKGHPEAEPGVHILGDFYYGPEEFGTGIFIFESAGLLSGIEVYGPGVDTLQSLPNPAELRKIQ